MFTTMEFIQGIRTPTTKGDVNHALMGMEFFIRDSLVKYDNVEINRAMTQGEEYVKKFKDEHEYETNYGLDEIDIIVGNMYAKALWVKYINHNNAHIMGLLWAQCGYRGGIEGDLEDQIIDYLWPLGNGYKQAQQVGCNEHIYEIKNPKLH